MAASNSAGGKQTHHSVRNGASRVQPVEQRHRRGVNHAELAAKRPQRVLFASGRRRRPRRAASPPRRRHSSGRAAARGRTGGKERARGANMPRTSGAQHVRAPRGRCSRPRRSPERCGVAQGRVARHGVAFRTKSVVRQAMARRALSRATRDDSVWSWGISLVKQSGGGRCVAAVPTTPGRSWVERRRPWLGSGRRAPTKSLRASALSGPWHPRRASA